MRTNIIVTNTIDTIRGIVRDLVVVVKRSGTMLRGSVGAHLMPRHVLPATAGGWLFNEQSPQPAYAAAYKPAAAAGSCRCDSRARLASHPSARVR